MDAAGSVVRELLLLVWELSLLVFHLTFVTATLIALVIALPRFFCALVVQIWLYCLAWAAGCLDVAMSHRHWLEEVEWA